MVVREDVSDRAVFVGLVRDDDVVGGTVQGVGFVEGVLRTPGQLHVRGSDGLFVGIDPGFGGDEGQRLLAGPVFDGRHVFPPCQEQIIVQIGVAEVDAVELAVELGQIFAQREVPQRPVVEPLVARLELIAGGERKGEQREQHHPGTERTPLDRHVEQPLVTAFGSGAGHSRNGLGG